MFGFSLSELIVVIVVALVVIGPKDLPKMLRKLGMYSGKLRRMAADLRAQSGIDEALRTEGLADPINEIRKLARGELDSVTRSINSNDTASSSGSSAGSKTSDAVGYRDGFFVMRDREYPRDGADAYGALPDNAIVYADGLPRSKLSRDPLYMVGDPDGIVPEPPPPPPWHDQHAHDEHDDHGPNGEPAEHVDGAEHVDTAEHVGAAEHVDTAEPVASPAAEEPKPATESAP